MGAPPNSRANSKSLGPEAGSLVRATRALTFLLGLALDIGMVYDLTHGHAAEHGAQEAALPPVAVGAVKEGQAQVAGEVGAFPEQGRLEWQSPPERKQGLVSIKWNSKAAQVFLQRNCNPRIFKPFFPPNERHKHK